MILAGFAFSLAFGWDTIRFGLGQGAVFVLHVRRKGLQNSPHLLNMVLVCSSMSMVETTKQSG